MMRIAMLVPVLLLAACGGAKTDERDTAAGKILPGSISDAMLQTDRLQSEAPLAAPKAADGDAKAGAQGAKAEEPAIASEGSQVPTDETAASPSPTPVPVAVPTPPPAQ